MPHRLLAAVLLFITAAAPCPAAKRRAAARPGQPGAWGVVRAVPPVRVMACTPMTLFAGTESGVYAIDESLTAAPSNAGIENRTVTAMAVAHTGAVFAATAADGVFRSTDNGRTWQALENGPQGAAALLAVHDTLLAGGCEGVFASEDQGETWIRRDDGMSHCVTSLAARGAHLYAGTTGGLFRSTNRGRGWSRLTAVPAVPVHAVVADPLGRMLAAAGDGGVHRSADGGALWSPSNEGLSAMQVRALFADDHGDVYAGTAGGGLFRSTDAGESWTVVPAAFGSQPVGGLCATNGSLFAAAGGTLRRTAIDFRLFGLDFGPYLNASEDPNSGARVTEERLDLLLRTIQGNTGWIRTYGTSPDLSRVLPMAHARGLRTAAGAWIGRDAAANETEIRNLIDLARAGDADLVIVGSEVLLRDDREEKDLIAYINQVQDAVPDVPVAYADTYVQWLLHPALVAAVDVVLVNYYPYWEGIAVDSAVGVINAWHRDLLSIAGSRPVLVSESGWPSAGNRVGDAVPSPENASRFFRELVSWARATRTPFFYFEAFDEAWKARYEGPQGANWGVWDNQLRLKPGMAATLSGEVAADTWTSTDMPGGPGTPSIAFTFVPEYGKFDDLRGRVLHVDPYLYKVLVYLYVGGWWTKPFANRPLTTIARDGTWVCDVTTGGIDERATRYAAFLVRSTYQPPILLGDSRIPDAVLDAAAAAVEVMRKAP